MIVLSFERASYTVSESDLFIELQVVVENGFLNRTVPLQFTTVGDTATG